MRVPLQTFLLGSATVIAFADGALASQDSNPGPWLTIVLGILLLRRAIIVTPQPWVVIFSGCFLTALVIAGNHELLNINDSLWIALMLLAFAGYGFWERIEDLWKQYTHRKCV